MMRTHVAHPGAHADAATTFEVRSGAQPLRAARAPAAEMAQESGGPGGVDDGRGAAEGGAPQPAIQGWGCLLSSASVALSPSQ